VETRDVTLTAELAARLRKLERDADRNLTPDERREWASLKFMTLSEADVRAFNAMDKL
jgi:hypothetical protein